MSDDPWILERAMSTRVLGAVMAASPEPTSPELARSLQAEENWWRKIENEFALLNSSETAVLLGAKAGNNRIASSQRAAGKIIGFERRHALRFPQFQFDLTNHVVFPVIPQLIAVARSFDFSDEDLMLWMSSPVVPLRRTEPPRRPSRGSGTAPRGRPVPLRCPLVKRGCHSPVSAR